MPIPSRVIPSRVIIVAASCLALCGCGPVISMGAGALQRSFSVGDDFAAWQAAVPPIPPGSGRIIVYPGGSRSSIFHASTMGTGGHQVFAVDRDVCKLLGHTFVYLDYPAGKHRISADDMEEWLGYKQGKNVLSVNVTAAARIYVRIDKEAEGAFSHNYVPTIVDAPVAEAEVREFPVYQDGLKCRPDTAHDRAT